MTTRMQIYGLKNTIDNKTYIGQSHHPLERIFKMHVEASKRPNPPSALYQDMQAHGIEAFECIILETIENKHLVRRKLHDWIMEYRELEAGYDQSLPEVPQTYASRNTFRYDTSRKTGRPKKKK